MSRLSISIATLLCLVTAECALAADMSIGTAKLVLKRAASGKQKLIFTSKDPTALFPAVGGSDDPVTGSPGGMVVTLVSPAEATHSATIANGATDPGWSTRVGPPASYAYKNSAAPSGASVFRNASLRDGRMVKVVARDAILPMIAVQGLVGIRVETGSLRNCVLFDAPTVVKDEPGRFAAKRVSAAPIEDCSDESLGANQVCGDGTATGTEQCDGADDAACPDRCRLNCTCSVCADAQVTTGEECDPPATQGGLASCNDDCTLAVCGDGTVGAGEECDPPQSGGGPIGCKDDCSFARCGDGVLDPSEGCETNADCAATEACSSCCTCMDGACPGSMDMTLHAGTGVQSTATEWDFGSTGIVHDQDHLDEVALTLTLCPIASSTCGGALVGGIDPGAGNCRCANDNRVACDEPFELASECGGSQCECYLRPPQPLSAGNAPTCHVWRFAQDVTGTWDADTGSGEIVTLSRDKTYLGEMLVYPCPTCDGDVTANDGIRDGTCMLGENAGESCDANAIDATFPAPGGGAYSYDCFPMSGKNISGSGLRVTSTFTTGASALPAAAVPCGFPVAPRLCACGECEGATFLTCTSNADCAGFGTGECKAIGEFPNTCEGEMCTDVGGGEGTCSIGPVDKFCDAVVRANGDGLISCLSNADCDPMAIGIAGGNCALSKTRECFLDPIAATGSASPTDPVLASTHCVPKTAGSGMNSVIGLPGPSRMVDAASTVFRCAANPASTYPGCP